LKRITVSRPVARACAARSMTHLMACADSGAGTMCSVRAKASPASKISRWP
jgi:hypothetical protein